MSIPGQPIYWLVGLLAMINPVASTPIFVSLTEHQEPGEIRQTALRGAAASGIIIVITFLVGDFLLTLFGIDIPAFQVAGGLLLLSLGLSIAQGKETKRQPASRPAGEAASSIAVVPLALPVTIGPGVISAIIVYAGARNSPIDLGSGLVIILLATLVIYATFRFAPTIATKLGPDGLSIATRIRSLILAAIGVQFIAGGIGGIVARSQFDGWLVFGATGTKNRGSRALVSCWVTLAARPICSPFKPTPSIPYNPPIVTPPPRRPTVDTPPPVAYPGYQ